jgi:serine/threonine protein kinase/Tol biopolymer transport system component
LHFRAEPRFFYRNLFSSVLMVGKSLSHYNITAELGRGGMGVVYKARDTRLDRDVAIKVLPTAALTSEDDRARFFREAKAAAQLHHPHIASVFEIDEAVPTGVRDDDVRPFIAMEFIEGETLHDHVQKGPLKLDEAVRIASQIASGLEAAHEKNIVHRDIKSANVMLTGKGVAKILDFGLAQTAQSTKLTRTGSTLGTVAYMSPEQARGEEVDLRTDLWSLGAVLYEMIAGRPPFLGDFEQAVMYDILNTDPEPLTAVRTGVPMAMDWIVSKLLAKSPGDRYQSAAEILVDLKTVDLTSTGYSRVSRAKIPASAEARKKSLRMAALALIAILIAAVSVITTILLRPATNDRGVYHMNLVVPQRDLRYPILSPDGRHLAYGGRVISAEPYRLFIYDFRTGERLTIPNSDGANSNAFSHDGSSVAFVAGGDLFTVPTTGGEPLLWTEGASHSITWGTRGEIYFRRINQIMRITGPRETPTLFLAPDSSIGQRRLFPFQVVPEAQSLLVVDEQLTGEDALLFVNLDDKISTIVMDRDAYVGRYTPTGHLIYVTQEFEPLLARAFDAEALEFRGSNQIVHSNVYALKWAFSQSGHFVSVRESSSRDKRLFILDSDGNTNPLSSGMGEYDHVRVSPDQRYLALQVSSYGREESEIVIRDTETNSLRPLIQSRGRWNWTPAWSPDGKRIVFSSNREALYADGLYVQNVDGFGTPVAIWQTETNANFPDWSSDGRLIVFVHAMEGKNDLWLYSFSEETARPLGDEVNANGRQRWPRFSPDSRFIAYESSETGRSEVFVTTIDGGSKWAVTTNGGSFPVWSRDGTRLYFIHDSTIREVMVELDPVFRIVGEPRPVYESETLWNFDVLTDQGGLVIVESIQGKSDYFEVIFNWFEELERIAPPTE